MKGWWLIGLGLIALLLGCDAEDVRETTNAYYGHLDAAGIDAANAHLVRVMPFYASAASLAVALMLVCVLNGFEIARTLGREESIRFGAWCLLVCFVSLFCAMSAERSWIPAGHPIAAFLGTAAISAALTGVLARGAPDRAVLGVGYMAVSVTLPLLGIISTSEIYLMDTTASLFVGFASGLLVVVVFSAPVRAGLVAFLQRRSSASSSSGR